MSVSIEEEKEEDLWIESNKEKKNEEARILHKEVPLDLCFG